MNTNEQAQAPPRTPTFAMLQALGGIAMLAGFLVVAVYQWTKPIIEENRRVAIERAVFEVVPGAVTRRDFVLGSEGLFDPDPAAAGKGEIIHVGYDEKGALKGIALEAAATGYQDVIQILFGYGPDCRCITGIKVLKMAETPGLGDKIAFDPAFLENFEALDGRLNALQTALQNEIVTVKHGTKTERWQIDAISGATISSNAIGRMINATGQHMFPLIARHLGALKSR